MCLCRVTARSYVQHMADTLVRLSVVVEVAVPPGDEESVRWAVERAAEAAAAGCGADVLRATATVDPLG